MFGSFVKWKSALELLGLESRLFSHQEKAWEDRKSPQQKHFHKCEPLEHTIAQDEGNHIPEPSHFRFLPFCPLCSPLLGDFWPTKPCHSLWGKSYREVLLVLYLLVLFPSWKVKRKNYRFVSAQCPKNYFQAKAMSQVSSLWAPRMTCVSLQLCQALTVPVQVIKAHRDVLPSFQTWHPIPESFHLLVPHLSKAATGSTAPWLSCWSVPYFPKPGTLAHTVLCP